MSLRSKISDIGSTVKSKIKSGLNFIRSPVGVDAIAAKYVSESLQYRNVHTERGEVGRSFVRSILGFIKRGIAKYRQNKLASSEMGRKFLVNMYMKIIQNNVKNLKPEELESLNRKLTDLAKNSNFKGEKLVKEMTKEVKKFIQEKIAKEVNDPKQAKMMTGDILRKIDRDIYTWISKGVAFNKNGDILDLVEAKLYTKSGEIKDLTLDPSKKEVFKQSMEILKNHGFTTRGEKYAKMVESKILVEAVLKSSSFDEAYALYKEGIEKRMQSDEEFRRGFTGLMRKELMRSYNAGAIFASMHELFVKFPAQLAATINRMLAQAVRKLPLLGDVAAIQYEAGAAMAEIGDKLSERIESLSHMSFNLSGNLSGSNIVNSVVSKSLEEAEKKMQAEQTASVPVA